MTSPDPSSPRSENLGASIARGSVWMILFKLAARIISIVSVMLLARLLTPADFGLVAMAMSVVAVTELMGAFGFDTALIQRKDAAREHYDTAWTFNVICSAMIGFSVVLLAGPAAAFYSEPRLNVILPVLAAGAFVAGFENIGTVAFRKELNFRREFVYLLSKQVASFAITVTLALMFHTYWALVAGTVTGKVFSVGISYALHPYRPRFSLQARGDLIHFSKWLFLSNLLTLLQNKSADFILGRTVGPFGLGIYNVSFELAVTPSTELIAPINRAVYPAYAQISRDLSQLRQRFLQVFAVIALIAFPAAAGLACVAEPAVRVLLGRQWLEAIPLLRILTFAGLIGALQSNLHIAILALGRPRTNTIVSAITVMGTLPIFVIASIKYGVLGAASTYLISSLVGLFAINIAFWRLTGVLLKSYIGTLWRPMAASSIMALVLLATTDFIREISGGNDVLVLLILLLVGGGVYALVVTLWWYLAGRPSGAERIVIDFLRRKSFSS